MSTKRLGRCIPLMQRPLGGERKVFRSWNSQDVEDEVGGRPILAVIGLGSVVQMTAATPPTNVDAVAVEVRFVAVIKTRSG